MSDLIPESDAQSEIELGKLKFQTEALAEAEKLGMLPNGNKSDESAEKSSENTEREYTEVEKEQMALGWDPHKTGPTAVSAEEFKRVGQIIEAKRAASKRADVAAKEVQELTKTVRALVEHNKKLELATFKRAIMELEAEKEQKISEGDVVAVKNIDLKLEATVEASKQAEAIPVPAEPQEMTEAASAYLDRNKFWLYGNSAEDKKMQLLTSAVVDYLKKAEPDISEEAAIQMIESEVKAKFPHRFENPNKDKAPAVIPKSTGSAVKTQSLSALSPEDKAMFLNIQKVDPTYTIQEFTKQLEAIGSR